MATAAALDYKSLFPEELPNFSPPPLDLRGAAVESLLREFQRVSEEYFSLRESRLRKAATQLRPQIADVRRSKRSAAASKHPRVRAVMTSLAERNLKLMQRYLDIAEGTYDKLIALRDEAVRRSFGNLGAEALAGEAREPIQDRQGCHPRDARGDPWR